LAKKRNNRRLIVSGILVAAMVALGVTASTVSAAAVSAPVAGSVSAPIASSATASVSKTMSFSASTPDGAYRVIALELPAGVAAVGTVTGPSHYSKTLALTSHTQTFLVRPGKYTLTAQKLVVTSADSATATPGTYLPRKTTITFTIKKHTISIVEPDYPDIISPNVSVAAGSNLTPFNPPANTDDPYTIGIQGTYAPGTIIASGVSPDAPYGLMVKVDEVGGTSDGVTSYTVENTSLEDAIPRGTYSQVVSNPVTLTSSDPGSVSPTSRLARHLQSIAGRHPVTTQSEAPPYIKALSCKGGVTAGIDAELAGELTTKFSANWNIFDSSQDNLTLSTTASLDDSITASIDGKASCDLDKTELLADPIELGTIEFLIGPVPVVINNTLNFTVAGSAEVDANFTMGIDASVSTSTGATIGANGITPSYSPPDPQVKITPPNVSLKGDAQFYLGIRVNMLLYDVAGPFVEAELGPQLSVDTTKKPWWNIDLGLKIGAGLRADFFGLEPIEDDHIYSHDFPIANSTTFGTPNPPPPHAGDPGTPGNPWNPPPVTPPTVPTDPSDPDNLDLAGTGLDQCLPEWIYPSTNQPAGLPVSKEQIAGITGYLSCLYWTVSDISALQYATGVTTLNLGVDNRSDQTYTDVSPLSGLTQLTNLDLSSNGSLTDVAPLASLTNLGSLSLQDDSGVDPSSLLPYLPNLTYLNIDNNQLSEPASLASLHKLNELSMIGVPVSSSAMTVISHLPLQYLDLGGDGIADLQDIGSMPDLQSLYIFDSSDVTDLSFVQGMTKLTSLQLPRDAITNASAASTLSGLSAANWQDLNLTNQMVALPKAATVGEAYDIRPVYDPNGNAVTLHTDGCDGTVSGNAVTFSTCVGYVGWSESGTTASGVPWSFSGVEVPSNSSYYGD
jgi:hypothetical protein